MSVANEDGVLFSDDFCRRIQSRLMDFDASCRLEGQLAGSLILGILLVPLLRWLQHSWQSRYVNATITIIREEFPHEMQRWGGVPLLRDGAALRQLVRLLEKGNRWHFPLANQRSAC